MDGVAFLVQEKSCPGFRKHAIHTHTKKMNAIDVEIQAMNALLDQARHRQQNHTLKGWHDEVRNQKFITIGKCFFFRMR
jgi:uncharacterized protein HemY